MEPEAPTARDHLANERTLLAWIRTAITVIGLGFIVDRLVAQGATGVLETWGGILLVLLGGAIALAGCYSYLRARHDLVTGSYRPAVGLNLLVVGLVVFGALLVAVLLMAS